MTAAMDIFVGADRSQLLAAAVLEHSIRRHTPAEIRLCPLIDLGLPEPSDLRQGSRTNFSFARFAIPELMNHQGRALYLDADMLVFRDLTELWSLPLDPATVLIQDGVPDHGPAAPKKGAPAKRIKQCSVMMIDCARARWDVRAIVAGLDGRYTYEQLMHDLCILPEAEIRYGIPFNWNSLEHYELETRLIHYTDMNTQPWVSSENLNGRLWILEVLLMLETGALTLRDLRTEIELGHFRPSLIHELQDMPHEAGFDQAAARRYAAIDREAGFVKHRDVYERKKARAEATKQAGSPSSNTGRLN